MVLAARLPELVSLVVVLVVSAALGCDDSARPAPPLRARHVVFVSFDTARADHFGFMGNPWIRTPRLDDLARDAVAFVDHQTVVPTTLPSHTTLFTGWYPHRHGTPTNGWMVNPANRMLPEILRRAGFHTAGFVGSFALDDRFGFAQGFDHYDERFDLLVGEAGSDQNQRSAESVTDAVIAYLDGLGDVANERLFLFVHYFDPHRHYLDRGAFLDLYRDVELPLVLGPGAERQRDRAMALARRYAAEISYLDHHVGRLLTDLAARGILDDAIVVVTSDHGENFAEHAEPFDHGIRLYDAVTRALWLVRLPGRALAGTRVALPTSSVDVLPTLLFELGLPVPPDVDGLVVDVRNRRLVDPASGASVERRVRFSQASRDGALSAPDADWPNRNKRRSARRNGFKLIQNPMSAGDELYDLRADPYEQHNLIDDPDARRRAGADGLAERLEAWVASATPLPSEPERRQARDTHERLKALGYVD